MVTKKKVLLTIKTKQQKKKSKYYYVTINLERYEISSFKIKVKRTEENNNKYEIDTFLNII